MRGNSGVPRHSVQPDEPCHTTEFRVEFLVSFGRPLYAVFGPEVYDVQDRTLAICSYFNSSDKSMAFKDWVHIVTPNPFVGRNEHFHPIIKAKETAQTFSVSYDGIKRV